MKSLWTFVVTGAVLIGAQSGAVAQKQKWDPEEDARFLERAKPAIEMMNKAFAYHKAGDMKNAEEAALQVLRMGYAGGPARIMLVKMYLDQHRYQEALTLCKGYLEEPTNHEERLDYLLGLCLIRSGRSNDARKLYSGSAVHISVFRRDTAQMAGYLPNWDSTRGAEANFLFALGILYAFETGKDAEALSYFEEASTLAPHNGVIALYRAQTLQSQGRLPEALPYYRQAAKSGPDHLRERAIERLPREEQAQFRKPE